ncbi:MAG: replication-relaxation family protein [Solirubrobacteraceae bacterium]
MTAVARRGRVRVGPAAAVSLSELDRRIIELVSSQRVVTSTQLELLLSDVPGRTLRYRTDHLHRAGLLGRSRPYRERGSAPYHLWPSRRADTLVRGAPVPRGGERAEPNPLFLAHAAGMTEMYALLATQAHAPGLHLRSFVREPRERFQAEGRSRTLAPDALLELHDSEGRGLLAFVELDLGTMSHARLKVKAGCYAAYAAHAAWVERYAFYPCLLFLTTTEARALTFLKTLADLLQKVARGGYYDHRAENVSWFAAGACAMARTPQRALSEPCWDDLTVSGGGLSLLDCLSAARALYDAAHALSGRRRRLSASGFDLTRTPGVLSFESTVCMRAAITSSSSACQERSRLSCCWHQPSRWKRSSAPRSRRWPASSTLTRWRPSSRLSQCRRPRLIVRRCEGSPRSTAHASAGASASLRAATAADRSCAITTSSSPRVG